MDEEEEQERIREDGREEEEEEVGDDQDDSGNQSATWNKKQKVSKLKSDWIIVTGYPAQLIRGFQKID